MDITLMNIISLIFGVALLLVSLALILYTIRNPSGFSSGSGRKKYRPPKDAPPKKVSEMKAKSLARIKEADDTLTRIKEAFVVSSREKDPKVHFMCVRATGVSQVRSWFCFKNESQSEVLINRIEWELWFAEVVKSGTVKLGRKVEPDEYVEDVSIEALLNNEELLKLSDLEVEKNLKCYIDGTIYCESPVGSFSKRLALFDLTYAITGLTEAKEDRGVDTRLEYDSLTGLFLRRYLDEHLQEMMDTTLPSRPFSFVMVDMDDFKEINDNFGHVGGDEALRYVASKIKGVIGEKGVPVRYGGDEFCIALPGIEREDAAVLAQKILTQVKTNKLMFKPQDGKNEDGEKHPSEPEEVEIPICLSMGVATAYEKMSYSELMKKADAILYKSKQAGKNRLMVEDAPPSKK